MSNAKHDFFERVISAVPRRALCHLPTPLDALPALGAQLGLQLYVKRDDQTGLGFGGNKSRKLEYVIADALAQGASSIITWAGIQSNWCRQLAAAARKVGLKPILVLFRRPGLPGEVDGNLLLDHLFGAEIHIEDLGARNMMSYASISEFIEPIVAEERRQNRKAYIAPIGASSISGSMTRHLGALAYAQAAAELLVQAQSQGLHIDHLVTATSSGSMQAGLVAGFKLLGANVKVTGIAVSDDEVTLRELVADIAGQLVRSEFSDSVEIEANDVIVNDRYIGGGYGLTDAPTVSAITSVAAAEGLLLDPVYTGKAMCALLGLAGKGYFAKGKTVVFLHTGGLPAIFPYRTELTQEVFQQAQAMSCEPNFQTRKGTR